MCVCVCVNENECQLRSALFLVFEVRRVQKEQLRTGECTSRATCQVQGNYKAFPQLFIAECTERDVLQSARRTSGSAILMYCIPEK